MPPLNMIETPISPAQMLEDQAHSLAISLVIDYLRSIIKSDKLAKKFEEKVPLAKNANIDSKNKENLTIDEIVKKHQKSDEGKYSDWG